MHHPNPIGIQSKSPYLRSMTTKSLLSLLSLLLIAAISFAQDTKKPLSHNVYEDWKSIRNPILSDNGIYASYQIDPAKGDCLLYIYNLETDSVQTFPRGYSARFMPGSEVLVFRVKAQADTVRAMKRHKVKKDKMPKDTLVILFPGQENMLQFAGLKQFSTPRYAGSFVVALIDIPEPPKDTSSVEGDSLATPKPKKKRKKPAKKGADKLYRLIVVDINTLEHLIVDSVMSYSIADEASSLIWFRKDSTEMTIVEYYSAGLKEPLTLHSLKGSAKQATISRDGQKTSWLFSSDTTDIKRYRLWYRDIDKRKKKLIWDTLDVANSVSTEKDIRFSRDGSKLYFGISAIPPIEEPEDTLLAEEKVHVDVWSWEDPLIQPMQKKRLKRDQERAFDAVWYCGSKDTPIILADSTIPDISFERDRNLDIAIGGAYEDYLPLITWEGYRYRDFYLIDLKTGDRKLLLKKSRTNISISPDGKFLAWYDHQDSSYHTYDVENETKRIISDDIPYPLYNIDFDMPSQPYPYGSGGWTADGRYLIYDEFDIWLVDPAGIEETMNMTKLGRQSDTRYRIHRLDYRERAIGLNGQVWMSVFDKNTKTSSYARLRDVGDDSPVWMPSVVINGQAEAPYVLARKVSGLRKAKESNRFLYTEENFRSFPDLWSFDATKANKLSMKKITEANPQMADYKWGKVELHEWVSYHGDTLEGLLYSPEDFDPEGSYPMIVYFYERSSNGLHSHWVPAPSRSVINPAYLTSNGYFVFMPDIKYRDGYPGQSAYDAIVSGTRSLFDRPYIDSTRLALQGQSWGGYQVAWLVTRTNLYKCAMAGAPVSNMTSAYGGIRWGSGMARSFQYERSQSRIGTSLQDAPELYIENSPVFFVKDINTPLLIMHNDNDGAVPWYQGIEMYTSMRRHQKPVWMLVYNNEQHNLTKWPNRVDLSIRMYQFFDFYLKDAPEPNWMKYGVPAIEKGKDLGY